MPIWIQKAAEGASKKRAGLLAFTTVEQVRASGNLIRRDIMAGRISYAKGIQELVFARNSMIANKNISRSDPRIKALNREIALTQQLQERYGR
jgi:hypothetical protein